MLNVVCSKNTLKSRNVEGSWGVLEDTLITAQQIPVLQRKNIPHCFKNTGSQMSRKKKNSVLEHRRRREPKVLHHLKLEAENTKIEKQHNLSRKGH